MTMPQWLFLLAAVSLGVAALCTILIILDLTRHPQHMWIMNLVWPITALYAGPLGLWAYYRVGRGSAKSSVQHAKAEGKKPPGKQKPFWQIVGVAATHCGSSCTLGDIVAEWFLFFIPLTLFGERIFAAWALDFVLAFLFGIAFQYFTIVPMRDLPPGQGAARRAQGR